MQAGSARVRVRVSPGAKNARIVGPYGGAWKVRVGARAEGGRANDAVLQLLSETLAVPRDALTLVSGRSARDKIVELVGLEPSQIDRRLASAAGKERRE